MSLRLEPHYAVSRLDRHFLVGVGDEEVAVETAHRVGAVQPQAHAPAKALGEGLGVEELAGYVRVVGGACRSSTKDGALIFRAKFGLPAVFAPIRRRGR